MRPPDRAFTLIETLVCLVIIMILTSISLFSYQGALDNADLKAALPRVARRLADYQGVANERKAVVTVEFLLGEPLMNVTIKTAEKTETERRRASEEGSLRRRLVFRRYAWPDGSATPATWTFIPGGKPSGGTVWFGSAFADGRVFIDKGVIDWRQS